MTLSNVITIAPTDAIYRQAEAFCRDELTLDNPEYQRRQRMGLWAGKTPKTIDYYRRDGRDLILPFGCIDQPWIRGINEIERDFAEVSVDFIPMKETYSPREYQVVAVDAMYTDENGILIAPTGSGKTVMMMRLIGLTGQRALWLCNTKELLDQAMATYKAMYEVDDGDIGVIAGGKMSIGNKITFGVVNTVSRRDIDPYTFGCVTADEAQFFIKSVEKSAMLGKCVEMFKARYKYACTATYHRADAQEKRIEFLFGGVKHEIRREDVGEGIMTPEVRVEKSAVHYNIQNYTNADGTLNFTSLTTMLAESEARNYFIMFLIERLLSENKRVLVLCDRVSQITAITELLHNDEVIYLTGAQTGRKGKEERERAIQGMRDGTYRCLVASTKLAGTGLDIPCLDTLIFASTQKDKAIVTQAVGRIRRAMDGKLTPVCYDIQDSEIDYCVRAARKRLGHYRAAGCVVKG